MAANFDPEHLRSMYDHYAAAHGVIRSFQPGTPREPIADALAEAGLDRAASLMAEHGLHLTMTGHFISPENRETFATKLPALHVYADHPDPPDYYAHTPRPIGTVVRYYPHYSNDPNHPHAPVHPDGEKWATHSGYPTRLDELFDTPEEAAVAILTRRRQDNPNLGIPRMGHTKQMRRRRRPVRLSREDSLRLLDEIRSFRALLDRKGDR